MASNLIIIR